MPFKDRDSKRQTVRKRKQERCSNQPKKVKKPSRRTSRDEIVVLLEISESKRLIAGLDIGNDVVHLMNLLFQIIKKTMMTTTTTTTTKQQH